MIRHMYIALNGDKFGELLDYVEEYQPSVICLTETWLHENNDHTVLIPGYKLYTANRNNRIGGGTCISSRSDLSVNKLTAYTSTTPSAVWVIVHIPNFCPIIFCAYTMHPPNADADATLAHLCTTTQNLMLKHKTAKMFVCGDFNKLNMTEYEQTFNLRQLVDFSTRGQNTLDLLMTDIREYVTPIKTAPLGNSDHCGIMLETVRVKKNQGATYRRLISGSSYSHSN